jgi:antitoxin CptB
MERCAMNDISKLRWQCRRGMKELDLLLENYLHQQYQGAPPAERRAFVSLLNLPDPVLLAYVMDHQQPATEEQRRVVARLRRTPRN